MKMVRAKHLTLLMGILVALLLFTGPAFSALVDLSTFSTDPGVTVNGGMASFVENSLAAIYLYNDTFHVPSNATIFSFNYALSLGTTDVGDSFTFDLVYNSNLYPLLSFTYDPLGSAPGTQYFSSDLTPYRNQDISLAWGLIWGGDIDDEITAQATVWNIDLATQASQVPLPSTLVLFSSGVLPLFFAPIRRLFRGKR